MASLLGVGFALDLAGRTSGPRRVLLIGVAVLTVVLSWMMVNTVYTLRYADLHFASRAAGIVFGDVAGERATYRDFAYVAFTVGMCYQVCPTRRCAILGSGAPCCPTRCCLTCSAW